VYAVEPSVTHLEALQAMLKQNDIQNVVVCEYAISNQNGTAKFYKNQNVTMYSLKPTVNDKEKYEIVTTITPDSFMELHKLDTIDLLKMDLEGSESEVVTSEGFRKIAPKIKVIVGEHHSWTSMSPSQFQYCLEELGYNFKWLKDMEATVFTAVRI
jgi:FkbM family methyltransferase